MTDNALVADVVPTRQPWTGMSLAENFEGLVAAIESDGWVDDLLAGAAFGTELVATAIDPFSALLANGLGWAMEYFAPLQQMLDDLAGMPDVVAAHAATWSTMAGELTDMATELGGHLNGDLPDWNGRAAAAYAGMMGHNVAAIGGLGAVAAAMASATRDIVRDLIADLVARVIVWAAEAIFVVTIPVIAAQITSAVVKWAGRILSYTTALVTSLTNLTRLLNG